MRAIAEAVEDLRGVQNTEKKDHERLWGRQSEQFAVISKHASQIDGHIGAILHTPIRWSNGCT